jgi:hypothetical protein
VAKRRRTQKDWIAILKKEIPDQVASPSRPRSYRIRFWNGEFPLVCT